jgi:hypothetical protein
MDDLPQALLIFVLGAVVTLATTLMIWQGYRHWQGRDPFEGAD